MAGLSDVLLEKAGEGGSVSGGSNKELMAEARMALSGNWGMGVAGYVLYFALAMSVGVLAYSSVFFVGAVSAASGANTALATNVVVFVADVAEVLLSGAFLVGFFGFFLGIAQEGEARLENLFIGFKRFWTAFGAYFLSTLFIILWSLLLIIPGIIAALRYAMVYFIIADDEECGPLEAIQRSKEMMKGYKWKYFCLHWRFFGWALLATFFTFGIGYLWLVPYMQTSFAKFYEDVK